MYANVETNKSHNWPVLYDSYSADLAHWETPPAHNLASEVMKTCANAICTAPISKQV